MVKIITKLLRRESHVSWALLDQALVSGVNFLTSILLARYLGLAEYGRLTLAWMAVLFFNSLQVAAIISPMMSIGPKQAESQVAKYYGAVFLNQLLWSTASFFLLLIGMWLSKFFRPEWNVQDLAFPLAAALATYQLQDFLRRYFFVQGSAALAFLNDVISYFGQLFLLVILFLYTEIDAKMALWVIAGTSLAAVATGIFSLGNLQFAQNDLTRISLQHWQFSKWLLGSAVMQWTSGNYFLVVAGGVLGASTVGAIRAAQNIFGMTHVLFQGLENVVPVKASLHYAKGGMDALIKYLKQVTYLAGGATLLIVLAIVTAPEFWLSIFYGKQFADFGYLLNWFGPIYILIFIGLPLRTALKSLEYTKVSFLAYLAMTLFSLSFAYPMINLFSENGVMLGILITQIISVIVTSILLKSRMKVLVIT